MGLHWHLPDPQLWLSWEVAGCIPAPLHSAHSKKPPLLIGDQASSFTSFFLEERPQSCLQSKSLLLY